LKRLILPFLFLLTGYTVAAQIVNIPDTNFKKALLQHSPVIDTNGDGQIQVSEAAGITYLAVPSSNISSLEGVKAFVNLVRLHCSDNKLTTLDVDGLSQLETLICGFNLFSTIQPTGLGNIKELDLGANNPLLTSVNLSGMASLTRISCSGICPLLTSVNLYNMPALQHVEFRNTEAVNSFSVRNNANLRILELYGNSSLSMLDLTGCNGLQYLMCGSCNFKAFELGGLPELVHFSCNNNPIKRIDVSKNPKLTVIYCYESDSLQSINLKNGQPGRPAIVATMCNNLRYVCADEDDVLPLLNEFISVNLFNVQVNPYCSFTPGGQYNTIKGTIRYDTNGNGCDPADSLLKNLKVKINDAANTFYTTLQADGSYSWYSYSGNFNVVPQLESAYFSFSPISATANFSAANGSVATRDFCLAKIGTVKDLSVVIVPVGRARPGFGAHYQIIYRNKGTETLSGQIDLEYDQSKMTLTSALPVADSQFTNQLHWKFTDLQPFQSKTIDVYFTLAVPPVNNIGDILPFVATISPLTGDITPADNRFALEQVIVGSYDPNDKTCLEGRAIHISKAGEYVHYLVRFQNMGTDTADNIVVKDTLSSNFDWNSVELLQTSHPCTLRQTKGNILEFIFKDILLPAKIQNEPASNGYVLFKVKSKSTLIIGDSLANSAAIYFDFNPPVITNTTITKYVEGVTVNLGSDISICGSSTILNASNSGARFLWNTGDTLQTLSVTSSGTYWVQVTNTYGFSASDTIYVTLKPLPAVNLGPDITQCGGTVTLDAGNAGSTYLWSNGATTQHINVTTSGTYIAKVTNTAGCANADTIHVNINAMPTVYLGADITQCGGSAVLYAGNTGSSYLWSNGAASQSITIAASGTYFVKVTNTAGCSNADTINVTINPLPVVNLGADITQCGGTVTLNAGNTGSNYLWSNGATTQNINVTTSGTYFVKATNAFGCSKADTINITINPVPLVNIGPDVSFCTGSSITLNAGNIGSLYLWNTGATSRQLTISQGGTYAVRVINAFGCSASDTILVTKLALPILQFSLPDTLYANDAPITLAATPGGGQFTGTGVSAGKFNPQNGTGRYSLQYSYTDAFGCSAATSADVVVIAAVNKINIYPNPSHGNFTIVAGRELRNSILTIRTPSGQLAGRYTITAMQQSMRIALAPGIYNFTFSNSTITETKRIVVL
jgi:uncharacterized repeat protein (TIGR01451 family)